MQTSVIFTATPQTGITTRLSLAIKRLGFKFVKVSLARTPDELSDLITFIVESERTLAKKDFASVISSIAGVTSVDVWGVKAASPRQVASTSSTATNRPVTPLPAVTSKPVIKTEKITAANLMPHKVVTDSDKAAIVKDEGRRLVGLYPAIHGPLMKLESNFEPKLRDELMQRIGKALGHWQYKKNFTRTAALGKTVRGSLDMQKAHFGGMPVISDLIFAGAKKEKELEVAKADPLTQIELSLSDFLDVSIVDGTIAVKNCPHCASDHAPTKPDCFFVRDFIQGFMVEIDILDGATVMQLASQGTGAKACTFEIRRNV